MLRQLGLFAWSVLKVQLSFETYKYVSNAMSPPRQYRYENETDVLLSASWNGKCLQMAFITSNERTTPIVVHGAELMMSICNSVCIHIYNELYRRKGYAM